MGDFLANLSAFVENSKDSTIQGEHCFLKSQGFSRTANHDIFYSKMLKVWYLMMGEEHSIQSLKFFPNWGMMYCGRLIIRATMEYPNIDSDCSLKDILEPNVDTKYLMPKEQLRKVNKEKRK